MPDIKFPCPGCHISLKVSETLAGKKIKCPKCAAIAPVPAAGGAAPASVPMAAPVARKPAAPIKPPPEPEEQFENDLNQEPSDFEEAAAPPARKAALKKKKRSLLVPLVALLLTALYVAGVVLTYLNILLPLPVKP